MIWQKANCRSVFNNFLIANWTIHSLFILATSNRITLHSDNSIENVCINLNTTLISSTFFDTNAESTSSTSASTVINLLHEREFVVFFQQFVVSTNRFLFVKNATARLQRSIFQQSLFIWIRFRFFSIILKLMTSFVIINKFSLAIFKFVCIQFSFFSSFHFVISFFVINLLQIVNSSTIVDYN